MTEHLASLGAVSVTARDLCRVAVGRARRRRRRRGRRRRGLGAGRRGRAAGFRRARQVARARRRGRRRRPGRIRHLAALGPDVVDRVLDDVERRRFLVEPAREDAAPASCRAAGRRAGRTRRSASPLPTARSSRRRAADDDVLPPRRLAGVKRDILDDAVALVEDAEHRDPLRHRRHAALAGCGRRRPAVAAGSGGVLLLAPLAARRRARAPSSSGCGGLRTLIRESRARSRRSRPAGACPLPSAPSGRNAAIVPVRLRRRLPLELADRRQRLVGQLVDRPAQPQLPVGRHPAAVVVAGVDHPAAARAASCRR